MALIGVGASSQSLVRVSLPEGEPEVPGGSVPVPGWGTQLQNHAVYGLQPEARVSVEWIEEPGNYGDGEEYSLRRAAAGHRARRRRAGRGRHDDVAAPAAAGLRAGAARGDRRRHPGGWEDPDDVDGDGISGRINRVWDVRDRRRGDRSLRPQGQPAQPAPAGGRGLLQRHGRDQPDLPRRRRRRGHRARHGGAGRVLHPHARGAGAASSCRAGRRAGSGCSASSAAATATSRARSTGDHELDLLAGQAIRAVHRSAGARHGRGPGRRAARLPGRRARVAHGAAVGARPGADGAARLRLPARRPRAHHRRGDPVARRRGRGRARAFRNADVADRSALLAFLGAL